MAGGWQTLETSAFLSQSEISPRGAPQFPVVLKRIASLPDSGARISGRCQKIGPADGERADAIPNAAGGEGGTRGRYTGWATHTYSDSQLGLAFFT